MFFYIPLLIVLAWGLINPTGIRGAVENNVWSVSFLKFFYNNSDFPQLYTPPSTHPNANIFLATYAMNQGNYDLALEYIAPLIQASVPAGLTMYGHILFQKEDYQSAFAAWKQAGNTAALVKAGSLLQEKGRLDLIIEVNQNLYEMDPVTYTTWYADSLFKENNFATAITVLTFSIEQFPDAPGHATWLRFLAGSYSVMNMLQEAETTYRLAVQENPGDANTWREFGFMYFRNQKFPDAIACFNKCIEADPNKEYCYVDAGQAYEQAGLTDDALKAYQEAYKINPESEFTINAIERLLKGEE